MRRIIISTLLLISLMSCNSKQTNEATTTGNNLFNEFISKLPSRGLPINLSCGLPDYIWLNEFKKYQEFFPANHDAIYGLIGRTENIKCIMFGQVGDDIYPTLFTYDKHGKRIDSLDLILNPCGAADESQIPHSIVSIDLDLQIVLSDTLRFIHYSDTNTNFTVDSLKVSTVKYHIDNRGRVNKN
jgi:hypothetical protein